MRWDEGFLWIGLRYIARVFFFRRCIYRTPSSHRALQEIITLYRYRYTSASIAYNFSLDS